MQAEKQKDDVKSSILISIKCAMTLFAVWLSIYLTARYCEQISTGFDYAWQGIVYGWEIFLIPFVAIFHLVASLPIELSVAAFAVALWSLCVTKKLMKQGLTGKFFKMMKNVLFCSGGVFVVLCSFKAISAIGFWDYFWSVVAVCFFVAIMIFLGAEFKACVKKQ